MDSRCYQLVKCRVSNASTPIIHWREDESQDLTISSKLASVISNSVQIDAHVMAAEFTTTHALHSSVVSGAGEEPAGGATRYPIATRTARQAAKKCENCMAIINWVSDYNRGWQDGMRERVEFNKLRLSKAAREAI